MFDCRIQNFEYFIQFEIYNVEITPGKGGQIIRSAGSTARLISLDGGEDAEEQQFTETEEPEAAFDPNALDSPGVAGILDVKDNGQVETKILRKLKTCENYIDGKLFDKSRKCLTPLIQENPNIPELYYNRGYANYMLGKFSAAVDDYSKALNSLKDNPDIYNNRGAAYFKDFNYDLATGDFEHALRMAPGHKAAGYNRILLRVFSIFATYNDYRAAVKDLDVFIQEHPDMPSAYALRGTAHESLFMLDQAVDDYRAALRQGYNPNDAKARLDNAERNRNLIQSAEQGGQPDGTMPEDAGFLKSFGIFKFWDLYNGDFDAGDWNLSLRYFEAAKSLNPGDPELYYYMALIHSHLRNFEAALATMNEGIAILEQMRGEDEYLYRQLAPFLYNSLGIYYYNANQLDNAIKYIQKAIDILGTCEDCDTTMYYYNLAWFYLSDGNTADANNAAAHIEAWIGKNKDAGTSLEMTLRDYYALKAFLLINGDKLADARDFLDKARAVREDEKNRDIMWSLDDEEYVCGLLEYSLGNTEEAVRYLRSAIEHSPDEKDSWLLLGRIYEETNSAPQAIDIYRELLKQMPGDGTIQSRLDRLTKAQ